MSENEITNSSGNVFEDLGLDTSDERLAKAELAARINFIIEDRGLTQIKAAELLGISQPKVSLLKRGRITGFSLEKLMRILNALDQDIEIIIHKCKYKKSKLGHIRVKYV